MCKRAAPFTYKPASLSQAFTTKLASRHYERALSLLGPVARPRRGEVAPASGARLPGEGTAGLPHSHQRLRDEDRIGASRNITAQHVAFSPSFFVVFFIIIIFCFINL